MAVMHAGKHTSGTVPSFSLSHTRTKHTLPHLPPMQRLNYPSTLASTRAEGRHTAAPVCPRRRDAQRCPRARAAAGPVSVGIHLRLLSPPQPAGSTSVQATTSPHSGLGCSSQPTCRRCGAPRNPLPLLARGNGGPGLSAQQQVRLCPRGRVQILCQEGQRGVCRPCRGTRGGKGAVCQPCAGSLTSLRVREEGPLHPGKALRLLSSSCYFLLLQWDCLATSIIPPRCVTGKILSSILMAFLHFTRPLVDLTTTITTTKASVKTSSPA